MKAELQNYIIIYPPLSSKANWGESYRVVPFEAYKTDKPLKRAMQRLRDTNGIDLVKGIFMITDERHNKYAQTGRIDNQDILEIDSDILFRNKYNK